MHSKCTQTWNFFLTQVQWQYLFQLKKFQLATDVENLLDVKRNLLNGVLFSEEDHLKPPCIPTWALHIGMKIIHECSS